MIEESSEVSSKYLGGLRAVEACRLVNDEDEAAGDASRIRPLQGHWLQIYKCVKSVPGGVHGRGAG